MPENLIMGGGVTNMDIPIDYSEPAVGNNLSAESQVWLTRRTGTIIEIDVCNEQNARLN